jgi:DNA-binding transcriptional ArsR family regulator
MCCPDRYHSTARPASHDSRFRLLDGRGPPTPIDFHLEDSGLVRTEKVGRIRTCYLRPEGLRPAEQWLAERRALWERRLDRKGALLDKLGDPLDKQG